MVTEVKGPKSKVQIVKTYDLGAFDPRQVVRLRAAAEKLRPMASEVAGEFRARDSEVNLNDVVAAATALICQAQSIVAQIDALERAW